MSFENIENQNNKWKIYISSNMIDTQFKKFETIGTNFGTNFEKIYKKKIFYFYWKFLQNPHDGFYIALSMCIRFLDKRRER